MSSGARHGALSVQNPPSEQTRQDPDLALIVERWHALPEYIKAAVKALVQAHADSGREEQQA